jgi:asparagine synthase (glutamine-hydrolysing)
VRLDSRDELGAELGIVAADARQFSDSDLVMRAIERWQEDAISRLIGDFALILWDAAEHRLILARDVQGRRPLHYHRQDRFIAIASMPKGLLALPEIPNEADEEAVAEFLAVLPERTPRSFFRGIERVVPGEILVFERQSARRTQYWQFEPKPLRLRDDEYLEATREMLDRAVSAQLRGAGSKVGSHLSGGLDSSSVTATAARLMAPKGKVIAFTSAPRAGFEGPEFYGRFNDESGHAAALAALYPNIEHVVLRGNRRSPLAALDRNFLLYDRPALNLCNNVWIEGFLDLAKERDLNVMLIAEFGNMTISYTGLEGLAEMLAGGRLIRLTREAMSLRRNGMRALSIGAYAVGPFLPRRLWRGINRLAGRRVGIRDWSAVRADRIGQLERAARARGNDLSNANWRDSVAMRKWMYGLIDDGNVLKGQLAGWGIDTRDPTLDRRLVELCLSIPIEQYLKGGQSRALVRRAFADRLPRVIVEETRKGYQAADWHEGLLAALPDAAAEADRIANVPAASSILDTDRLRQLLGETGKTDWNSWSAEADYRLALLRGISAGHFLRKASGAN